MTGEQSILVLRLGAIGDALRVLPAVRRLRLERPRATIGWAIEDWVYPLLAGNPNLDRFHVLNRGMLRAGVLRGLAEARRFVREVREARYDIVLDFHGRLKSGVIGRLSGARRRIGYARGDETEANYLFNNIHVSLCDRYENRVLRFMRLLAALGIEAKFDASETGLHVDPAVAKWGQAWHQDSHRPKLAAYPGTSRNHAAHYRWPREKWVELLRRLRREEVSTVLLWGPDDMHFTRDIFESAGNACTLAPETTLTQMMAMIGCFNAFIGSNTGAMHMAWLQGIPTAVFPGPTYPRTDAPLPPVPSRLLWAGEHFKQGGSKRHLAGVVTNVSVDQAFAAVMDLLTPRVD